jgi:cobalt-zinc-cadmium resistance protein CzcA
MVRKLIEWAVNSPLVVVLLALALVGIGGYSFREVNVEAYPDPAPAIIEVVAQYPGASAEEVERQVTIPLEVALAGIPRLKYTRSKSLFALSYLNNQFEYGLDFDKAKQEVINRLSQAQLPPGVTPQISPRSPLGEFYRYTLDSPKDEHGQDIYNLNDLKALQDWTLSREFLRVPRIGGVVSFGGTTKRYEVHPDPDRLKQYGITLTQLQNAITGSNANVGGDYLRRGDTVKMVRGLGLLGWGQDPMQHVLGGKDPVEASAYLRTEEARRLREIRQIVLAATNNVPVRVDDVVEGGAVRSRPEPGEQGVVVGHLTRLGKVSLSRPVKDDQGHERHDADGRRLWRDEDEKIQGLVLLRKGEESLPALRDVKAKVKQLNATGDRLLPGVKIDTYYDRTGLVDLTTLTVRENLLMGMLLVTVILLMFLNNVRTALIVAINIPLALLFAFAVLYLRGKSANLLSIGAVDFGIIVDSSVIMVENIYRHISSGEYPELPLRERIVRACREVEVSLFFSTLILVCALLPLLTMQGPEGQIFGPMADTYAFALGGALLLALTLSPVLCLLFFRNLRPAGDNFLVRALKAFYLWQLEIILSFRWLALGGVALVIVGTVCILPFLGQEFMPELEEGNLWIRGIFPVDVALEEVSAKARIARGIMQKYPEVELIAAQLGRPDDGTDPVGFYSAEFFVPLKHPSDWPIPPGRSRPRTKGELIEEMNGDLNHELVGVDWDFSQQIRDNVMEVLSGVQGENSVKIFGPDLAQLERLGDQVKQALSEVRGLENPGVYRIMGQANLEFPVDRDKCARWNINVADVHNVIQSAVGGKAFSQMIEGEKTFDLTLRWPARLRDNEDLILDIPVDVMSHTVTPGSVASTAQTPVSGPSSGLSSTGTSVVMPSLTGSSQNAPPASTPRRPLRDLVMPLAEDGQPSPQGSFTRPGASMIYREQGNRMIAVKFGVRGRDLASAVAEAQARTEPLLPPGYRAEWSGEFQEMQHAQRRLLLVVALSLTLILVLLYMAFRSLLDAFTVFSGVLAVSVGGVWALFLTGTNFNISAAVGFISVLGVAIMNGLLMVSSFNRLRQEGQPVRAALFEGVGKLVRPITMTALAALFGLLPAALSTRIGSQSQRPLAIVVVGGMLMTLILANVVPLLYSFYGHREPPAGAEGLAH